MLLYTEEKGLQSNGEIFFVYFAVTNRWMEHDVHLSLTLSHQSVDLTKRCFDFSHK